MNEETTIDRNLMYRRNMYGEWTVVEYEELLEKYRQLVHENNRKKEYIAKLEETLASNWPSGM